jgi:hypothetical protein
LALASIGGAIRARSDRHYRSGVVDDRVVSAVRSGDTDVMPERQVAAGALWWVMVGSLLAQSESPTASPTEKATVRAFPASGLVPLA